MSAAWEKSLPKYRGRLPGGGDLVRTDPGGAARAPVAILGLHPVETRLRKVRLGREQLQLPAAVEERAFEAKAPADELRERLLAPLGLTEDRISLHYAYPYYLASNAARGGERSMWATIQLWRQHSGETDDVQARAEPSKMADACRELPGNLERMKDLLARGGPGLLLTLGAEAAAFVRGCSLADGQRAFYAAPERREAFGTALEVVHLANPAIFTSVLGAHWRHKHEAWCAGEGGQVVQRALR